jgi:hypothetical protein
MTPHYKCNWVISGTSTNKGDFREEGSTSVRHFESKIRTEEDLKDEVRASVLSYLTEHERTPWRPEPRYADITGLRIELGVVVAVGCEIGQSSDEP